jgi:hypothetical protein
MVQRLRELYKTLNRRKKEKSSLFEREPHQIGSLSPRNIENFDTAGKSSKITDFTTETLKEAEMSQVYNYLPIVNHFCLPLNTTSEMEASEGANRIQLHYHLD